MLQRWMVLALAVTVCPLVASGAADARTKTTHWYTINVADPPPASPAAGSTKRFVGNGNFAPGNFVTMQQYEPNTYQAPGCQERKPLHSRELGRSRGRTARRSSP